MTGIAGAPRPRCHPALPPAALLAVLLVAVGDRYGPHGDELYFRMLPLRWWYDDQPPLTVWLTAAAGLLGDDPRLLRLPAVLAAVAGVFVAAAFPAALGAGPAARRLAAWAHAFTVYPLLMGHLFLTAALDFLAWQVIVLFALRATLGRPQALVGAGIVAGLACWNKLLVLVLVAALTAGLLLTDRALLRTRAALAAAAAVTVGAAPQLAAQLLHGLPTRQVSADLVTTQGTLVRAILIPATVVFLGPPLAPVWWRGLTGPWREADRRGRLLLPTAMIMLAWALVFPGQPYYAAPALFPALATGFARTAAPGRRTFSRPGWGRVVAANSAVSVLICLPVLPVSSPLLPALAVLNRRSPTRWAGRSSPASSPRRVPVPASTTTPRPRSSRTRTPWPGPSTGTGRRSASTGSPRDTTPSGTSVRRPRTGCSWWAESRGPTGGCSPPAATRAPCARRVPCPPAPPAPRWRGVRDRSGAGRRCGRGCAGSAGEAVNRVAG